MTTTATTAAAAAAATAAATARVGTRLSIRMPDDFHHHVRDGVKTKHVLKLAFQRFGRLLIMPNTRPPITNTLLAKQYKQHILDSMPVMSTTTQGEERFIMTLYLTDRTTPQDVKEAHQEFGKYVACKYYPAGATTNSYSGVTDVTNLYPVLEEMQTLGYVRDCLKNTKTSSTGTGTSTGTSTSTA